MSYLHVLEEPTSFEENEKEFYATFPSFTLCRRQWGLDGFTTFENVTAVLDEYKDQVDSWFDLGDKWPIR